MECAAYFALVIDDLAEIQKRSVTHLVAHLKPDSDGKATGDGMDMLTALREITLGWAIEIMLSAGWKRRT